MNPTNPMNPTNNVVISTFDSANVELSQNIYTQFTAGKVIPRFVYNTYTQKFDENELYTQLYKHLDTHYSKLYRHLGFDLVFNAEGEFFHIRKEDTTEEADENATKVQALLLIIARYWTDKGLDLEDLAHEQFGLKNRHIEELQTNEQYERIRLALLPKEDWSGCLRYLMNRNFLFQCGEGHYVFSSAGMFFINHHVAKYQSSIANLNPITSLK